MGDNDKQEYHDKGEQDAAEHTYDPPHGMLDITTWSEEGMAKHQEEREAYDKGWDNGKAQRND